LIFFLKLNPPPPPPHSTSISGHLYPNAVKTISIDPADDPKVGGKKVSIHIIGVEI